jgi:tetraacyldisaccharide 4'-kinase
MAPARCLLMPLAVLYAGVIRARNLYYARVGSAVRAAGVPVISVGNITTGGTGKTPMVAEIVRRLLALGRRPAILTRGYGAASNETADEVREFLESLPDVPVMVNPDRVAGAASATAQGADCLVLDDGFQHRRLARDLDIVLVDALQPWGGGCVLPAGRLREPLSSLRRADAFVITRTNQATPDAIANIVGRLRRYGADKPIVRAEVQPEATVHLDGRRGPLTSLVGRHVLAVCGIGNPRTFEMLVESLTGTAPEILVYADHHRYSAVDVNAIGSMAGQAGVELVVTTHKDWVKLAPLWPASAVSLVRLDMRLLLTAGTEELDTRLRQALMSGRQAQQEERRV